jgi:hypothetical protein
MDSRLANVVENIIPLGLVGWSRGMSSMRLERVTNSKGYKIEKYKIITVKPITRISERECGGNLYWHHRSNL